MRKVRVYELAKELNISSKELLEKMEGLDLKVSSHMSSIEKEEAQLIKELLLEEDNSLEENYIEKLKEDELETKKELKDRTTSEKLEDTVKKKLIDKNINSIEIESEIMVKELAEKIGVNSAQIITKLIGLGVMVNQNQSIDSEIATIVADEFGFDVIVQVEEDEETEEDLLDFDDDPKDLVARPPVVTVMGHVDHGKTSLLDAIRHTNVTGIEAGGITQHIGAYAVIVNNKKIVFLDTPGHEAFTAMRARGAKVTDIAILVVAADDGVMPQTIEAISHSKAAGVPIIVAINKIDKPDSNLDRIKQELSDNGLVPEEWGGDTIIAPVSAKNRTGIEELLEMILLVAEMQELKANPNRKAIGTIIEAQLDKGKGPLATVLVQKGTLNIGDMVVSGTANCRI